MDLKRKRLEIVDKVEIAQNYLDNKQERSARDVADLFDVKSQSCILDWAENIDKLPAQIHSSKKIKPITYTKFPKLEKELIR